MKVEIINKESVENLYLNHGIFACTCYATPEKYAEKVGRSCEKDGHMSGSRCEYIKFRISGIDRGTAEQALRHEIGVDIPYEYKDNYSFADYSEMILNVNPSSIVKNMASFRYIDKDGFEYETPGVIKQCPEANDYYDGLMKTINQTRGKIHAALLEDGVDAKKANEAVNFVLPRATTTDFVIGMTPEALIHFCHKRLCTRAQEFIRELAKKMKVEIEKICPEFANELVPHCQYLMWCPEGNRCCGAAPTREELLKNLNKK